MYRSYHAQELLIERETRMKNPAEMQNSSINSGENGSKDRVRMRLQIDIDYEALGSNVECDHIERIGRVLLANVLAHISDRGLIANATPLRATAIETSVRTLTRIYAHPTIETGVPAEIEPDEWADSLPRLQVQSLCVAYQQGLDDAQDPLAHNPYPTGTPQQIAYDLGKKDAA